MNRKKNFLSVLIIVILGTLFFLSCDDEGSESSPSTEINADSKELLQLINNYRASGAICGTDELTPAEALQYNEALNSAAVEYANEMQENNNFSHTGQDGSTFSERASDAGYEGYALGENIAYGYTSEADVINAWMNSTGHCSNIMNDQATEFGIARSDEGNYWVMITGKP